MTLWNGFLDALHDDVWLLRLTLLLAALAIDAVIGDPRWLWSILPHPVVWIGKLTGLLDPLTTGGVTAGRKAVSQIVGRDPETLDEFAVARAAIESLAENFSDGVVAPALAYLLFGPVGLCAYKALNTLDSMIGHRSLRYEWFGKAAARLDDVVNLIPARLSGIMLILAALITPTANPWRAAVTMVRDARKHRSWNAGWPEGAMAGALDLALAGPRRYGLDIVRDPWIGEGRARALPRDISRALLLFAMACLIQALILVLLIAWRVAEHH